MRRGSHTCLAALLMVLAATAGAQTVAVDEARAAAQAGQYTHAEQLLRDWLRANRDDAAARFLLARVLSWQGKQTAARREYDMLLRKEPHNSDYLLGKAQTLLWSGRPHEALPLLEHARTISPDYEAIWRLQITALLSLGDEASHEQALQLQEQARQRFPAADWEALVRRPAAKEPPPPQYAGRKPITRAIEVEGGFSYEDLTRGRAAWRSVYVAADSTLAPGKVVYGRVRRTERYSLSDSELLAGMYYPLNHRWTALIESNVSTTHRVLPKWSALAQLGYAFDDGWGVQLGVRRNMYNDAASSVGSLTVERYWNSYRAAYTLSGSRLDAGGSATTHKLAGSYYYGKRNNVGLALVTGQEVDNIVPLGVRTTSVHSLIFSGTHWFAPDWAIAHEIILHQQGDSYSRRGFRLGLRHRF